MCVLLSHRIYRERFGGCAFAKKEKKKRKKSKVRCSGWACASIAPLDVSSQHFAGLESRRGGLALEKQQPGAGAWAPCGRAECRAQSHAWIDEPKKGDRADDPQPVKKAPSTSWDPRGRSPMVRILFGRTPGSRPPSRQLRVKFDGAGEPPGEVLPSPP